MDEVKRVKGTPTGRLHLRHHWQDRNRGKEDRWQECRDCGKTRPVPDEVLTFYAP